MATDPLTAESFGNAWPPASSHYQAPSHYTLDAARAVAVILAAAGIGLAAFLTVGLRFCLPARSAYPLPSLLAAVLAWFGATRLGARPRRAGAQPRRAGGSVGPAADAGVLAASGYDPRSPGEPGPWVQAGGRPPGAPWPDWPQRGGPGPSAPRPAGPEFAPQARPDLPAGPPYGRILIFTLLEDRVADFDHLAEQTAEEIRTREPDTLVYVIHLVPNAPMQRIFYEIYRDRAAFDSHENAPYMKRFVADRRACVLATNVIELRLKYAKVAPLPGPQPSGPPAPVRPRGAPRPQPLEPLPPGPDGRLPPGPDGRMPPRGDGRMPPRPDRWQPPAERPYGGS